MGWILESMGGVCLGPMCLWASEPRLSDPLRTDCLDEFRLMEDLAGGGCSSSRARFLRGEASAGDEEVDPVKVGDSASSADGTTRVVSGLSVDTSSDITSLMADYSSCH